MSSLDEGKLLTYYFGHGGIDNWAHENILTSGDIPWLYNQENLSVVVSMSCLNGWFHHVQDDYCMAEEFIRTSNVGAAGMWAPTGWTSTESVNDLGEKLFTVIFNENPETWSEAFALTKINYYLGNPYFIDILDLYTYFGDPALKLFLPR
jgi:hypothetical protein